jgi:hypothetical protein
LKERVEKSCFSVDIEQAVSQPRNAALYAVSFLARMSAALSEHFS